MPWGSGHGGNLIAQLLPRCLSDKVLIYPPTGGPKLQLQALWAQAPLMLWSQGQFLRAIGPESSWVGPMPHSPMSLRRQ